MDEELQNSLIASQQFRFSQDSAYSKNGFVHGDLQYEYNKTIFRCNDPESFTLIPSYIDNISKFHSNARFILVVEKFTAFANLIASKINKKFRIIMVTGCGYPDFKTRKFVQKLWFELRLPIFALIDGDSYGVDIALSYKYGSVSSAYQNHELIVPEIQWLGVLADDIEEFELQGIDFSPRELKKFQALQQRPDVRENIPWLTQMIKLRDKGIKVEIQALLDYSSNFLVDFYLPFKLFCGKWI
ncbi:Meiotic recombination protein SPO11 [Sarcoptes scabiei]|uniref:Meiotic recombination protein SPO11 n=1 Tax=Sarcoptes scabiei TaxID=52283 RepID=A0A834REF5_SARSC|nr:Meiotic recombination protein SPO11 [Sarcoptes scabiei]